MSTAAPSSVSLKEYLKRYESGADDKDKKKKKKKKSKDTAGATAKPSTASGVLIVDEDPVWQRPVKLEEDESSDAAGEDEPVVDEDIEVKRLRRLELLRAKKPYLSVSEDGSGWVSVDAPPSRSTRNDTPSPARGTRAPVSGDEDLSPPRQRGRRRHYTPSPEQEGRGRGRLPNETEEEEKTRGSLSYRDRSPTPPRGRRTKDGGDLSPRRRARHDSPDPEAPPHEEDMSPPRRNRKATTASTEDMSRPRRNRAVSPDMSPPRRDRAVSTQDMSPPRRNHRAVSEQDMSPPRRNKASGKNSSPPRSKRAMSMEDVSPPRSRRRHLKEDLSPPRRRGRGTVSPDRNGDSPSDADLFPPRKNRRVSPDQHSRLHRSSRRSPSEEDLSPPRRRGDTNVSPDRGRRFSPDADLSPPRKTRRVSPEQQSRQHRSSIRKADEAVDTDISPPRRRPREEAPNKQRPTSDDLSPPRKAVDRAEGERRGGLYTGGQIKEEIDRKKAEAMSKYARMDPDKSGKGAEPVFRDKATGKRISKEEKLKLEEMAKERKKPKEIKLEWGKGLAQKREAEAKAMELELEKEKPFARTMDDPELDKHLKERIRWGDPMAHLVKRKDPAIELKDFGDDEKMKESGFIIPQTIPSHSWIKRGIDPPANRYGIKPGRHWDGVNRSTGYEEQLFKRQSEKRATQTEAYLWSVSDM